MPYKILITSVGSRAGQALLDSLASLRQELIVLGTNSVAVAPGLFSCDKVFLLPSTSEQAHFKALLTEIILNEKPDLVIPARDEELAVLAQLRNDPHFQETAFLVGPEALAPIFNDKYETYLFAQQHAFPFAPTAYSASEARELISEYGFPLLAKPRWNGHASKDVYVLTNETQLANLLPAKTFVFQAFLHAETVDLTIASWESRGIPWTFSLKDQKHIAELVIGKRGEIVSMSCNVSHETGEGGKTWRIIEDPELVSVAEAYGHKLGTLGYQGPVNLQGKKLADGRFIPFELNGRFTGSVMARTNTGYNQVLHALNHFLKDQPPYPRHTSENIFCAVKKAQGYDVIYLDDLETLKARGCWQ